MEYKSPCDTCKKCINSRGCEKWKIRYLYRQKQINAITKKSRKKYCVPRQKFIYEHPDILRRYITKGPCAGCKIENVCDTPCSVYWNWWDARMEIARKKAGI